MEGTSTENQDLLATARGRVQIGAPPDWVISCTYNPDFTPKNRKAVTHLLIERQAHVERHEVYHHMAVRLETMQAVQHGSQWRVEFEPNTMSVVLHSVKTRRGDVEIEHNSWSKIQFLQREAGLEGFFIDGWITLLIVLEDVSPGDVLEFSYTITSRPRLMPENCAVFFALPLAAEIGRHHFSVRHAPTRPVKWKSSSQNLAPVVHSSEKEVQLTWQGENVVTLEPEEGAPPSLILYPWMQFSDCADWQTVARAVHEAWVEEGRILAKTPREETPPKDRPITLSSPDADSGNGGASMAPAAPLEEKAQSIFTPPGKTPEAFQKCLPTIAIAEPASQRQSLLAENSQMRVITEAEPAREDAIAKLIQEIKGASTDLLAQVNHAIKIVQDGFRYLSVNVELGGQIPAEPETVIRRKFGDCKDLAFLLSQLLRGLGVSARPVLVHTGLRKSISNLLPSTMFDHVVVEFQIGDERRWIDATMKFQGGGALGRFVPDFGFGLPVDPNATELVSVPKPSLPTGAYELKDSFLLDTAGNPSHVAVFVTAKGIYAEQLRAEFENSGVAGVSKKRLHACASRFYKATRVGEIQWRDDREKNEMVLAEMFEIDGFLRKDAQTNSCVFDIRSEAIGALALPPQITRRDPFGLLFPCHQTHTVEIDFLGLDFVKVQPFETGNKFFAFSRDGKSVRKYLKVAFTVQSLTDVVPAKDLAEHRKQVETAWRASGLQLRLPMGYTRIRRRSDFGALPATAQTVSTGTTSRLPASEPTVPATVYAPDELTPGTATAAASAASAAERVVEKPAFKDPRTAPVTMNRASRRGKERGVERSSRPRFNLKCIVSLCLVFAAIWLVVIALPMSRNFELRPLSGLLVLLAFPAIISGVLLAIWGLRDCGKHPASFRSSRTMAQATLWVSGFLSLLLVPLLIVGIQRGIKTAKARRQIIDGKSELLRFRAEKFNFYSPALPWRQVDARNFGPLAAAAFACPGPISFVISPVKLGTTLNATEHLIQFCKDADQRGRNPYHLMSERNIERNGVSGWQMESEATFQGHESYGLTWVVVTSGYGYVLRIWGPPELTSRIKEQAEYMFSRFEPTAAAE